MKRNKPFNKQSHAEQEREIAALEQNAGRHKTRSLTAIEKAVWNRAQLGRPRKVASEKSVRVLISVDPDLLGEADTSAKRSGKSRSEFIADGIRLMLRSDRKAS